MDRHCFEGDKLVVGGTSRWFAGRLGGWAFSVVMRLSVSTSIHADHLNSNGPMVECDTLVRPVPMPPQPSEDGICCYIRLTVLRVDIFCHRSKLCVSS